MSNVTKVAIRREVFANGFKAFYVVQYMKDGSNMLSGHHVKNEEGAQRVLKREAKKHGFTVTGDTAQ